MYLSIVFVKVETELAVLLWYLRRENRNLADGCLDLLLLYFGIIEKIWVHDVDILSNVMDHPSGKCGAGSIL